MKYRLIVLTVLGLTYPYTAQAQIYKCIEEDTQVVYQDTPCKAGQAASTLGELPLKNPEATKVAPLVSVVKQESQSKLAVPPANLVLGMTDTEVLNMRGWGRPGKITRSKDNRVWREQWAYISPVEGARLLQFANGRLTAIHTEPVEVAQIIPQ